ncbi:hypothetical protein ABIF29_005015 [Bradyrhizobium elkanii]|uniref:Uncharacterized protein n=1 Tax=Bradyrhizobium elkanii TaxID=29448 RepID=A0ABV4F4J0_BRAEL
MRQYLGGKLCIQNAEPICVDRPIFQALRFAELCLRQFGCAALVWCVYFNKTLANLGFPSIVTRNRFHEAHDISRHFHHSAEKPSRPVVIMRRVNRQGFDVDQRDLTASELSLAYVAELASLFVHRPQRGSLHTKQIREVALLAASLFPRGRSFLQRSRPHRPLTRFRNIGNMSLSCPTCQAALSNAGRRQLLCMGLFSIFWPRAAAAIRSCRRSRTQAAPGLPARR